MQEHLDRAKQRLATALRHRDVAWTQQHVPQEWRYHPAMIRQFLVISANGDPKFGASAACLEAFGALEAYERADNLTREIAAIYHDPKVQLAAGDKLDWYWAHPAAAKQALLEMGAANALPDHLDRALNTIYAAEAFSVEQGGSEFVASETPLPALDNLETEIAALVKVSASRRLTPAEDKRLDDLYGARYASEEADRGLDTPGINQPLDGGQDVAGELAGAGALAEGSS